MAAPRSFERSAFALDVGVSPFLPTRSGASRRVLDLVVQPHHPAFERPRAEVLERLSGPGPLVGFARVAEDALDPG